MTPAIKTHMDAHLLFLKRARGHDRKKISRCLWLRKDGENFLVTDKHASVHLLTLTRDDVATIHFEQARAYLGRFSVVSHLWRYFGIHVFHRVDRRSSQQWWYRYRHLDDPVTIPLVDNMRINLRTNEPLDPPAVVQRRRVQHDVAKPVRDKIADWEKFARSFLALSEMKEGMLSSYAGELPTLEEEPTTEGLMKMLRWGAERGFGQALYRVSQWGVKDNEWLRSRAKRAFKAAFERWKEDLYTEHGVFKWVDKAA